MFGLHHRMLLQVELFPAVCACEGIGLFTELFEALVEDVLGAGEWVDDPEVVESLAAIRLSEHLVLVCGPL